MFSFGIKFAVNKRTEIFFSGRPSSKNQFSFLLYEDGPVPFFSFSVYLSIILVAVVFILRLLF